MENYMKFFCDFIIKCQCWLKSPPPLSLPCYLRAWTEDILITQDYPCVSLSSPKDSLDELDILDSEARWINILLIRKKNISLHSFSKKGIEPFISSWNMESLVLLKKVHFFCFIFLKKPLGFEISASKKHWLFKNNELPTKLIFLGLRR